MPGICALIKFKSNQNLARYAKNTGWLFSEQIAKVIGGVFVGTLVARYLGPDNFGILNYSLAIVALCGALTKLGLDSIVVRELVHSPESTSSILSTAFWLKSCAALIAFLILLVVFAVDGFKDSEKFTIIISAGLILQSFEVIDFYFQANVLSKYVSIVKIIQLIISISLKILCLYLGKGLIWFVCLLLLDQMILGTSLYLVFKKIVKKDFFISIDFALAKRLLKDSYFLIFSSIMVMIYLRVDQIVIKKLLGDHELGLFSAAVRLSEVWYIVPGIITTSLTPAILNAKKMSEILYYKRIQALTDLLVWSSIGIGLITTFSAPLIIKILYGEKFALSSNVLVVHIWTGVFASMGVSSAIWYLNEGYQKLAFYRTLVGAVLNLALNFPLIMKYGIIGSAYASLISQMMAAFGFDFLSSNTRVIFNLKLRSFTAPIRFIRIVFS